jgi:branched-chain amino acid transport system ATP-binding protein
MTAPVLEARDLSISFGGLRAVDGVSFAAARNRITTIIGPNGAGKSTLFNLITGMLRPDRGSILLEGRDITALPPEQRCRAGLGRSFQIPLPFEHLSVFENLAVAALFGGGMSQVEAVQVCGETLALTGLEAKANLRAGSLSLLDRKRLELARALATRPRILLLDEIAGGLTDAECQILIDTIRSIHARGIGIIWIEHVVHALLAVVSRLVVLDFGRIVAQGVPSEVMRSSEVQTIYMGVPA